MKYIFADATDQVDPGYDFLRDQFSKGRKLYWTDVYPHEMFKTPPYDGILISRGIVGCSKRKGKYTDAQAIRLRREGAREFLRLNRSPQLQKMPIFGDCGAFSYAADKLPLYNSLEMVEFYSDVGFTHGCSVDHIIFGYRTDVKGLNGAEGDEQERFDITQENADEFLHLTKSMNNFTPLGVVQGWSPDSMAIAASNLEKMGYKYLALGGMVPLDAKQIHEALRAIRERIKPETKLHILGFAKAEQIHEFKGYGIASFDSTSPLIRAFKDAKANYYKRKSDNQLDYYTAIRIPLATDDTTLTNAVKEGRISQDDLVVTEQDALTALRAYDKGDLPLEETMERVMAYQRIFLLMKSKTQAVYEKTIRNCEDRLRHTLRDAPWKSCHCDICRDVGIEVAIFRASNRNKRRGFHNLFTYYEHVKRIRDEK